jgi:DNA-binding transcriptional regulator WhiA
MRDSITQKIACTKFGGYGKNGVFRVECQNCRSDEIGKHTRLKIAWGQPLGSSSLPSGTFVMTQNKSVLAYITGVALGDGNLSNPNGRATRLRVTCDKKYPNLILHIQKNLETLFPKNKISLVNRTGCVDISCYSNQLEDLLEWRVGSKSKQLACVPQWILKSEKYTRECLRGLLQTDGSIYKDRGYIMINYTTIIQPLSEHVISMLNGLGYKPQIRRVVFKEKSKYVIRVSKNVSDLIEEIDLWKN